MEVRPEKIVVAVGKNGAGKSTLLESLSGSTPFHRGSIYIDKRPLKDYRLNNLACIRAVLAQSVSIAFPISVEELVEMGSYASPTKMSNRIKRQLVEAALFEVGMEKFIDRRFQTLSGGEQKRVLLAKCIVQLNSCKNLEKNQYLFLDEPTASLDIQQQYRLIELIKRLTKKHQIGVFAILHDINLAAQLADEILMMKAGKIIKRGHPADILTAQSLKEVLGIHALVQPHPVYGGPHMIPLPHPIEMPIYPQ